VFLLLWLACTVPYPKACSAYENLYCNTCELSSMEQVYCGCIQEGVISAADFPEDYGMTQEKALQQCESWKTEVESPSASQSSYCRQALTLLKEHKNEICANIADSAAR
jgi:hypothetical protein